MHLVELTERSSSIIMVQRARRNSFPFFNRIRLGDWHDRVAVSFQSYNQLGRVSVRPTTAISALSTMHRDICHVAEDKRVKMIILPFHKQWRGEGDETGENLGHDWRGAKTPGPTTSVAQRVCIIFFGGPDDREALQLGGRMAEHPAVNVTVIRFVEKEGKQSNGLVMLRLAPSGASEQNYSFSTAKMNRETERELDETAIVEFQSKCDGMVEWSEKVASNYAVEEVSNRAKRGVPSYSCREGPVPFNNGHGVVSSVLVIQQHDVAHVEEAPMSKVLHAGYTADESSTSALALHALVAATPIQLPLLKGTGPSLQLGEAIVLLASPAGCEPQHHEAVTLLSFLLNEPYNGNINGRMLRHPPTQLQGLPIVRPTKEDYANPLGHRGSGPWSLGLCAKSTVHKQSHRARRILQNPLIYSSPVVAQILPGLVALPSPLFVEGQDDHLHPLILRHVANIPMHSRQGGDSRFAETNPVEEGKAVPAGALDHDNGRRSFRELHEMHDEELQNLGAPGGLYEGDEGGYICAAMNAGQNAKLVVVRARRNSFPFFNRIRLGDWHDRVAVSFQSYNQLGRVSVRPTTAISALSTMHRDICHVAEDKRVKMIILPFHKQWRGEGDETGENLGHDWRGAKTPGPTTSVAQRVCIIFFGGPDDREALQLGGRMAEHPAVNVTVIRFVEKEGKQSNGLVMLRLAPSGASEQNYSFSTAKMNRETERELDETAIVEFQSKCDGMVEWSEKVASNYAVEEVSNRAKRGVPSYSCREGPVPFNNGSWIGVAATRACKARACRRHIDGVRARRRFFSACYSTA
ncbi:hypothetical protein FH972_017415 [Carpinus fangiana]|uniref:Cation/H+ exchanger domain-containing protein n=1 Tax=Carpinus fangiana TaxID=176857 RepID=A0A5N6RIU9_9ROSI|nr:hypothetical protein FH972_017415 [Carpinus fangiana]